ncbi:MAG: hypothetical protein IIA07_14090 [Proteobacteria bacterium]|nr:hypothetical protein [Pseudomonadota bacterium]
MEKPDFTDAVYESFFSGGYASAAASGALDKGLYDKHVAFFRSMDQGAPLVAWCHFVDTYFGDRDKLIDKLDDDNLAPIVRLLFYVRNAFVHCGWDVSKLNRPDQREKIQEFCDSGGTYPPVPVFKLIIDEENHVHVDGLMGMCMTIACSVGS